jgi:predicted alpha/beta hydrolase family esterase
MKIADTDILIQPGWENSGEGHWQRRWGERFPNARIIEQEDWDRPQRKDWVPRIEREVMMATRPVVLVAHSLGTIAAVHAAQSFKDGKVRGAFLVSPPDLENEDLLAMLPRELQTFANVPRDPLPFPSMLVVSTNDQFCSVERAVDMSTAWGSDLHLQNNAGHINVASGHGPWPEGLLMFTRLMQRLHA